MAQSLNDLPRMQNQARSRAPTAGAVVPKGKMRKPQMMRQYELIDRVRRYNPQADEALLNRAYVYAMKAHGSQRRASGDPYFSHPLEVAAILTDLKLDDATIAAALLHDTIEDTPVTRAEIDKLFGPDIGTLVDGLTKLKKLDLVSKQAAQAENLRKLLLAIADDVRVLLVKLADRLHNMRTLEFVPPESRRRTAQETLDIYAPLAARMGMQEMRVELEDLGFRELNPDAYRVISQRLQALAQRNRDLIAEIEQQLTRKFADRGIALHHPPQIRPVDLQQRARRSRPAPHQSAAPRKQADLACEFARLQHRYHRLHTVVHADDFQAAALHDENAMVRASHVVDHVAGIWVTRCTEGLQLGNLCGTQLREPQSMLFRGLRWQHRHLLSFSP